VPTRRWLAAAFVLTLIAPALAQDAKPVKLEWKFEKDKTFYQTIATDTSLTLKLTGAEVNHKHKETFIIGWTPLKQEDKNWVIRMKIEGVHVDGDFAGGKVAFDSTSKDNPPGPLTAGYKALVGAEFTLVIGPDMNAIRVEGGFTALQGFVKKMAAANPQTEKLLSQLVTEDTLKAMADATFAVLPNKEVKKGDKWDRTAKRALGAVGTFETTYHYTYDGPSAKDANVENIAVKADMTYKAPSDTTFGAPFKIKSADLKSSEGTGTIEFRKDRGRVEKSKLDVTIKGKMTIDLGGSADVDVTQTQTTTVTTSDENPVPKKK
jgi:uncharacterized protein DUF6263